MKKVLFVFGALLTLGMFYACSSDDGIVIDDEELSQFEDGLHAISDLDYTTGYMLYDKRSGWYIKHSEPIDRVDKFFPLNLPDKFKEEGIVLFSGKTIKMTDEERESLQIIIPWAGVTCYYIYLTKMEKLDKRIQVPYRGNPPFAITDMPGTVGCIDNTQWCIQYHTLSKNILGDIYLCNTYYPTEISDEFKVYGMKVIISGNVYEEITDSDRNYWQKDYRIELTKIEKAE